MAKLPDRLTWEQTKSDDTICSFEHPMFGSPFDKGTFEENFGKVLEQLDGTSEADYVSFFFERSPSDPSHLVYTDKDSQQDFLEWVQDEGLMPTTKEVHEGEDKVDKDERKAAEDRAAQIQREKKAAKKKAAESKTPEQKEADMIANRVRGLNATVTKLSKESREKQLEKLRAKVATAQEQIAEAVDAFKATFPEHTELLPEEYRGGGGAVAGSTAAGGGGDPGQEASAEAST